MDESVYFKNYLLKKYEREKDWPELKMREKPCDDCAVIHGLYTIISDALKEIPEPERMILTKRWFCHEDQKTCCKGNWDNIYKDEQSQG